jgi:siroheme synthase
VTTLARVVRDTAAQGLGSPSIIAIGEMVKLRAALVPFAITLAAEP